MNRDTEFPDEEEPPWFDEEDDGPAALVEAAWRDDDAAALPEDRDEDVTEPEDELPDVTSEQLSHVPHAPSVHVCSPTA